MVQVKFFKDCLPQMLISPFLNTLPQCNWYEFGEKSGKYLTLEKCRATQNIIRKLLSNEQEITDLSKINTHIYHIYQHLYNEKQNTSEDSICDFLNDLAVLSLTMELSLSCKENLT